MGSTDDLTGPARLKVEYRVSSENVGALAYGLSVSVKEASGIPSEVFVYHVEEPMLATGFPFDRRAGAVFQNVATPVDIEDTPPESDVTPEDRYFRSSSMKVLFRCKDDLDRALSTIKSDIASLVECWGQLSDESGYESVFEEEYTNGNV